MPVLNENYPFLCPVCGQRGILEVEIENNHPPATEEPCWFVVGGWCSECGHFFDEEAVLKMHTLPNPGGGYYATLGKGMWSEKAMPLIEKDENYCFG